MDEGDELARIGDHNLIIDQFENDLRLQAYVSKLYEHERQKPLKGLPGNTLNRFEKVADYDFNKTEVTPSMEQLNQAVLDALGNEYIINRSLYILKTEPLSNMEDFQKELDSRPVNPHYHLAKGRKFDVRTPENERHAHVADRLGHPELLPSPLETLLRFENVLTNPAFQDQGHIRMPPIEPNADVNFAPGEVIYYKPSNLEA